MFALGTALIASYSLLSSLEVARPSAAVLRTRHRVARLCTRANMRMDQAPLLSYLLTYPPGTWHCACLTADDTESSWHPCKISSNTPGKPNPPQANSVRVPGISPCLPGSEHVSCAKNGFRNHGRTLATLHFTCTPISGQVTTEAPFGRSIYCLSNFLYIKKASTLYNRGRNAV